MQPHLYYEEYSQLILGSAVSPGVVELSGHDRYKEWTVTQAKGTKGAVTKLQGDKPGSFTATFFLAGYFAEDGVTLNDFEAWDIFQRLIESMTAGPIPIALPIYHPDLARNGFTEVTSGGVSGMKHTGHGMGMVQARFIEYKPERPSPARKAKASVRMGTTVKVGIDPNAGRKAELDALLAEVQNPGGPRR